MTFDQKIPKWNSRPVYCLQLYGMHINVTTNFIQDEEDVFGSNYEIVSLDADHSSAQPKNKEF